MARRALEDLFTKDSGNGWVRFCNQCGKGPLEHDMIDLEECFELLEGVGWDD